MIKCAITGSSGVLGKRLLELLPFKFYEFKKDIRDKNEIEKWIQKQDFEILIHLAALVPVNKADSNHQRAYDINVKGTKNLIEALIKKKNMPKWFFYSSTSHVYKPSKFFKTISERETPKPQNFYGKTKLLSEKLLLKKLQKFPIKLCIGRIFSFSDKRQTLPYVLPSIIKKFENSKKIVNLKNLNNFRDFLNIRDIILAINILRKKQKSGIFNIGSGDVFNLKEIATLINKKYKKKIRFKDECKSTYLIANNKKLKKLKWKPKKFNNNINYFY